MNDPKSGIGIVFIHGICGNCSIFDFLEPEVPQGWTMKMVTLPGHGGDALAFSRSSMKEWRQAACQAIDELSAGCSRILGVGHSMGCLLLLEQAAKGRVESLFLLNPPMKAWLRQPLFTNLRRIATGRMGSDPTTLATAKACGISIDFNPLHYYGWLPRFIELLERIRITNRRVLPGVACPIRAFVSARDEMVSPSSARAFDGHPTTSLTILPSSTHLYYAPADRATILAQFRLWTAVD